MCRPFKYRLFALYISVTPFYKTTLFIRFWMGECEHIKWITTPSSRVYPHLLSQRGHTQHSHIRGSPLIMPLVAWWVLSVSPATGVLYSGATRLTASRSNTLFRSLQYSIPRHPVARVPSSNKWMLVWEHNEEASACMMTLRMRECKYFHHNVRRTIHAIGNSLSEAKIHESRAFISLKKQTNQGLFFT